MRIIHHLTTTTTPPPPCLNNPAGQLHLYVNTRLGSDSPHMATNNLWKNLEFESSKLCSSQFGQTCFMPLSYYSGADERTKHGSWQEPSVWSQISCGGNQANGTNTMDAKMFGFFKWEKTDRDQPSSVLRTLWPEVKTQQAARVTGHSSSPLNVDIQSVILCSVSHFKSSSNINEWTRNPFSIWRWTCPLSTHFQGFDRFPTQPSVWVRARMCVCVCVRKRAHRSEHNHSFQSVCLNRRRRREPVHLFNQSLSGGEHTILRLSDLSREHVPSDWTLGGMTLDPRGI